MEEEEKGKLDSTLLYYSKTYTELTYIHIFLLSCIPFLDSHKLFHDTCIHFPIHVHHFVNKFFYFMQAASTTVNVENGGSYPNGNSEGH